MYKIIVLQLDTRSLVLCVCFVDRCRSFCPFSFGHCVVCPSIYRFWLPPFGIYKLFLYLSDKKKRTEISNQTDTLYKLNSCKLFGDELIFFLRIHLIWIMKRKLKHSTNIKKTNSYLWPQITEHKKTTTYDIWNAAPIIGQTQRCGGVKLVCINIYCTFSRLYNS